MNGSVTWAPPRLTMILALVGLSFAGSVPAAAQPSRVTMVDFGTGNEFENYLRVLQIAGIAPLYPWSLRGFSQREVARLVSADTAGPWALRGRFSRARVAAGPLAISATFNSAYPYGANDGPVWAGRGVTSAITAGAVGNFGPLSLTLAPMAFHAANGAFELMPNGRSGLQAFNHGSYPGMVDLPQRFGDEPYSRFDPGGSSVRFDSRLLSLGVSTANQWLGPATEYPFLLGNNAPGFPHLFVGTGEPLSIWIGHIHARLMWGKLYQSDYSPVSGTARFIPGVQSGTVRLATSASAVIMPRGIPGLELGIARFIHVPNAEGEPSGNFWGKAFKVFFLNSEYARGDSVGLDNQLVSAFFRWVFPNSGFEVFGERGYEDHLHDFRELIQNPDHNREYMLGFQKVIETAPRRLDVLRAEVVNYQLPTIARLRRENAVYLHAQLFQGHTNRGQLLGASPGVAAAAASTISWSRYSSGDRTTVTLRRIVRDERGNYHVNGFVDPRGSDVIVAAGVERMRFGRRVDIGARVEGMRNYNRNFSQDVGNLNLQLTATLRP